MYICELLPLKTTKKIETLTYFTMLRVNIGDLVQINMNNQILSAIIINLSDIKNSKSEIKAQDFKVKKIEKIIKEKYISTELLKEIYNLSTLLGTTMNNLFNTLLPINILPEINFNIKNNINKNNTKINPKNIFVISPTIKESKQICKELTKDGYIKENFSTPSLAFLLDKNIDTVIINKPNSRHYYSFFKDIDTKKSIEYFCKILNIKVEYLEEENNKININICDINKESKLESIYLTKENYIKIENYLTQNKKIALYVQRLGNSTSIVCEDCKSIQKCSTCDKPYILKKYISSDGTEINYLFCNACKVKIELNNILKCTICKSFRLLPLGIGLDGLSAHIKDVFEKKSQNYLEHIKIITEKDIGKLKNIDLLIVISLDSLFSINEYSIDENIFHLLSDLANSCNEDAEFIIQTRLNKKVFDKFLNKNAEDIFILDTEKFYALENKIREKNNLPPYSYILTYESELEISVPKFLEKYKNYKIKTRTNIEKYITKNRSANIKIFNRYIYFIEKDIWEQDTTLRSLCVQNLYALNLKINPSNVLK